MKVKNITLTILFFLQINCISLYRDNGYYLPNYFKDDKQVKEDNLSIYFEGSNLLAFMLPFFFFRFSSNHYKLNIHYDDNEKELKYKRLFISYLSIESSKGNISDIYDKIKERSIEIYYTDKVGHWGHIQYPHSYIIPSKHLTAIIKWKLIDFNNSEELFIDTLYLKKGNRKRIYLFPY